MKPFDELTHRGQVKRLRALARSALSDFGLHGARLTYIAHAANTAFRVDTSGPTPGMDKDSRYAKGRFLLRIHRPGYQTSESIRSELMWLSALSSEAGLAVPRPVKTVHGTRLTTVAVPGVPQPRHCTLLRWMDGRFVHQPPSPAQVKAVGKFMGHLHQHAAQWHPPEEFNRRHWDWEGLFGSRAGFGLPAREVWALVPQPHRDVFGELVLRVKDVMAEMGKGADAYGLVHADLNFYNILFAAGEPRVIDFDDCGFGYWLHDIAVTLSDWQGASWPLLRDAFLDGYTGVRPLAEETLEHLDLFMAAQDVAEALWVTDMAQRNPDADEVVDEWQIWAAEQVSSYLVDRASS